MPTDWTDAVLEDSEEAKSRQRKLTFKLGVSFFLFGLINNVLYVIILSAALDLVPPATPKGIIAFCNIAPALVAKVGWPYILKGRIRYVERLIGCSLLSFCGMVLVAFFDSLEMRLIGIGFASFSSGLGELTFLQLSTRFQPPSVAGHSVGYFASGTGAAGLVGAFLWWEVRSLGVRFGVGLSSVLPFILPLTYFYLMPQPDEFTSTPSDNEAPPTTAEYAPLPTSDSVLSEHVPLSGAGRTEPLSASDKWVLVKPLLMKYMLPLFCVYTFEYTINQGIAPTLIYPVPDKAEHPIMGLIIHSLRDYYPLWQLVYQTTVFISRSSISMGLPPLPARLLPLPAIVQLVILLILATESGVGLIPEDSEGFAFGLVFFLISLEGICGGSAYVNVFHRVNQDRQTLELVPQADPERKKQEKEFQIGSIGFADSLGILLASIIAVPTEVSLCNAQAARGKLLCREL